MDYLLYNNNAIPCDFIDTRIRKETIMTVWQELTAAAVMILLALVLLIRSSVRRSRDRKWRSAERKLTTVLQSKETVKAICPQKKGRWILTSRRLLFETREGFHAVVLKDIKKVRGNTKDKKTTTVPSKMVSLTVFGPEEYLLRNTCEEFEPFAKQLRDRIRKQNAGKKKKK